MKTLNYTGKTLNGSERTIRITPRTLLKIGKAIERGFDIVITKTYKAPAGYSNTEKLCQTNDRMKGYIKHSIFAVSNN